MLEIDGGFPKLGVPLKGIIGIIGGYIGIYRVQSLGFGGFPKLGVPFKGITGIIGGYIGIYRVQSLGFGGFPKLGVPFWRSPD